MSAQKTTTNPLIISQRKNLERNLSDKRDELERKKNDVAIIEKGIADLEDALKLLPLPAQSKESQEV